MIELDLDMLSKMSIDNLINKGAKKISHTISGTHGDPSSILCFEMPSEQWVDLCTVRLFPTGIQGVTVFRIGHTSPPPRAMGGKRTYSSIDVGYPWDGLYAYGHDTSLNSYKHGSLTVDDLKDTGEC